MSIDLKTIKKICGSILLIYILCVGLFLLIGHDTIHYSQAVRSEFGGDAVGNMGELIDGREVIQEFQVDSDVIDNVQLFFMTYERKNQGTLNVELMDMDTQEVLAEEQLDIKKIDNGFWKTVRFEQSIEACKSHTLGVRLTTEGCSPGNAITIGMSNSNNVQGSNLLLDGTGAPGQSLTMTLSHKSLSANASYYYYMFFVLFIVMCLYFGFVILKVKHGKLTFISKYSELFLRYKFLMKQLISRDFVTKYKKSVLGVLWSFLNPLLTMLVQYAVFSNLFRFKIENYSVYLLTGIVLYNGFTEATTNGLYSIVGNAPLITKVYVPKYIYPIAKVLSSTINLVLSLIPLLLVTLATGVKLRASILLLPYGIMCQVIFAIGVSMLLSSLMVFFRDVQFLWGVFTMLWMYLTPIIYSVDILPGILQRFMKFNPLFYYVDFARTIIINGVSPEPISYVLCAFWALLMFGFGALVFKKTQDKFILNI